jgi:hypothetical protein
VKELRFIAACLLVAFQLYVFVGVLLEAISDTRLQHKTGRCRHYGLTLKDIPRTLWRDYRRVLTWPVNTKEKFFG